MKERTVYLKIMQDGSVAAFGDEDGVVRAGGFDMDITQEEWNACGNVARAVDGKIVLGYTSEEKRVQNERKIRMERAFRLQPCDMMNPMRWNAMTEEQRQAWTDYRQALLDITDKPGFPWNGKVEYAPWPKIPE